MEFTEQDKIQARFIYAKDIDMFAISPGAAFPQLVRTSPNKSFVSKMWSERYDAQWCGETPRKQWKDTNAYSLGDNLIMFMPGEDEACLVNRTSREPKHKDNFLASSIFERIRGGTGADIKGVVYVVQIKKVNDEHEEYEDLSEDNKRRILEWDNDDDDDDDDDEETSVAV
jgi:hypothetical protein